VSITIKNIIIYPRKKIAGVPTLEDVTFLGCYAYSFIMASRIYYSFTNAWLEIAQMCDYGWLEVDHYETIRKTSKEVRLESQA